MSEVKTSQYTLIVSDVPEGVVEQVNEMLAGGWNLFGSPSVTMVQDADKFWNYHYVQALVKGGRP